MLLDSQTCYTLFLIFSHFWSKRAHSIPWFGGSEIWQVAKYCPSDIIYITKGGSEFISPNVQSATVISKISRKSVISSLLQREDRTSHQAKQEVHQRGGRLGDDREGNQAGVLILWQSPLGFRFYFSFPHFLSCLQLPSHENQRRPPKVLYHQEEAPAH